MKGNDERLSVAREHVVKVGGGRGFIIMHRVRFPRSYVSRAKLKPFRERRLVVTAAHCLPKLPPAHGMSDTSERTYESLLGNLDGSKRRVSAECLFVDPVADIAVLGCPDNQELANEADAYNALTGDLPGLQIREARRGPGWILALDGPWEPTRLEVSWDGGLSTDPTRPGMSGSPILNRFGRAVGIVALGGSRPQPVLTRNLPGWLLQGCR